jgi:uncharacterized protein (TIGR01619 family)
MAEDWDFYFLNVDDKPASIYLNLGLAHAAPVTGQDHMAYVRIFMRQPRPDGLSSQEEYEALTKVEDELTERLEQRGDTYAGRNTSDGNRDLYFYTGDLNGFEESVSIAMADHHQYRFEVGGRPDPEWDVYRTFLYPSPDDLQRILNRRVIKSLEENGDNLSKPRTIDHFAYMPSLPAAESLRKFLSSDGFDVDEPRVDDDTVALAFKRMDSPDQIDEVVVPIARRTHELGGEYDGWGCTVVD